MYFLGGVISVYKRRISITVAIDQVVQRRKMLLLRLSYGKANWKISNNFAGRRKQSTQCANDKHSYINPSF